MKELTYSLLYNPNYKPSKLNISDYVCFDKKIHVRFKDYKCEEVINTFDKKLNYLLTYLINYSYIPNLIGKYNSETIIKGFVNSPDVQEIATTIKIYGDLTKFKGFKLLKNVKKQDCKDFGDVLLSCFPLDIENNVAKAGSLKKFLDTFHISLNSYLFDDKFIVYLSDLNQLAKVNKKFDNKKIRRNMKNSIDTVELW